MAATLTIIAIACAVALGPAVVHCSPRTTKWVFQPGSQLAIGSQPVTSLQSTITDIGSGRVTDSAPGILSRDTELLILQERPLAIAVLLPAIPKWMLVVLVAFLGAVAAGRPVLRLLVLAITAVALLLAYAPVRATQVLAQHKTTHELCKLGDAAIDRPSHYRFFVVSDLTIQHRRGGTVLK
ncbi:MAG: hypothetical protein E6I75_28470 [Chloroflexi bacterium]|nr:MAG: hypothetical protein E6I75_28470 [Chloroflexota bacterium]